MPTELAFGESMPGQGNLYLRVKKKGDQIQFRLAQNPTFVGKHFIEKETGWDVPGCPRINSQEECERCDLFFKAKAELKKLEATKPTDPESLETIKRLKNDVRQYGATVTFYFPILDRGTGRFGILQTTSGVRNKLNAQHEAGVDVFKKDWILRNTGSDNPNELYSLIPVDSADTKPFTEEEEAEFKKAQEFNPTEINDGASQADELE